MKEIKWALYTLYVAAYTSLIWATVMWDGIMVNIIPLGIVVFVVWTVISIAAVICYIGEHWNDKTEK